MKSAVLPKDPPPPPLHVAIIMDGNGRWATSRGLPRIAGHQRGAEAVRRAVRGCIELGIPYLTLYAFSSENWKRPAEEIHDLMGLLRHYLRRELDELSGNGVRLQVIGDRDGLDEDINRLIALAQARTAANARLHLIVALNYGGRGEITTAMRRIAAEVASGQLEPDAINEEIVAGHLATVGIPDPDLVIRTSGECRLSNFLLWQSAYAELVFIPTLWPDFEKRHLEEAIDDYHRRERRYGGASG